MPKLPRLTPRTAAVLRALLASPDTPRWGQDIMHEVNIDSGSLHPILARLREAGVVESVWEDPQQHEGKGRPRRRYHRLAPDAVEAVRAALDLQ